MEAFLSKLAMLICYADDCGLWYEITDANRLAIVDQINQDLESLMVWGRDSSTTFEPSKTHFTLISKRTSKKFDLCFPHPRTMFDGGPLPGSSLSPPPIAQLLFPPLLAPPPADVGLCQHPPAVALPAPSDSCLQHHRHP